MTTSKNLGIWMDHASAHVMELTEPVTTSVITSKFTHEEREKSLQKGENKMHNKEQGQQLDYYKQLGEMIKAYDDVLLFGPTDAKIELMNMLRGDHSFDKIRLEAKPSERLTEKQEHAFVKAYFLTR